LLGGAGDVSPVAAPLVSLGYCCTSVSTPTTFKRPWDTVRVSPPAVQQFTFTVTVAEEPPVAV